MGKFKKMMESTTTGGSPGPKGYTAFLKEPDEWEGKKKSLASFYKKAMGYLLVERVDYYEIAFNLVRKYKYRESKIKIVNDKDLLMCEMSDYKDNIKTIINDSGIFYLFKISDLINIINKSLSNSPSYYFFEPKELKNPYNNNKFSLSNLYNIYFAIKSSTYTMPIIYQLYFDYNFDFKRLLVEGECIMKDVIIDNKIKSLDKNDLIRYIKDMLYDQHFFGPIIKSIDIHAKFPPDVLIFLRECLWSKTKKTSEIKTGTQPQKGTSKIVGCPIFLTPPPTIKLAFQGFSNFYLIKFQILKDYINCIV